MASLAIAAAIAAAQAWQPQSGATSQATATVRIVSGERVRFDAVGERAMSQPTLRDTKVRIGGTEVPARLVEFY